MIMKNDGVTFEVAGGSHTLRFSVNALCDLEDATGVGVNGIGAQLGKDIKLGFVRACFWAGLRHARAELTIAEAGEIIGELGIERAGERLTQAMTAAFPSAKKEGAENPLTPPTTGTTA